MASMHAHATWKLDAYGKIDCHYEAENSAIKMSDAVIWQVHKSC